MTIEQLNKWQDIIRGYNNSPINYEDMVEKSAKEGLAELVVFLKKLILYCMIFLNCRKKKFH